MPTVIESLGQELSALDREYEQDFAGHSRLTRDLDQMDRMLARAESVIARVAQVPPAVRGPDLVEIERHAAKNLEMYRTERTAIARAQDAGPAFETFSMEATSANLVFARYGRHFAGKDRATRDPALLGELVDDLKHIDKRMNQVLATKRTADFERDLDLVRKNVAQYQNEIELIEKAHQSGGPEDQANLLATLANNQFANYQTHFAGEARVSRRPALLMRVVSSLRKIQDRMSALQAGGLDAEFNTKNIGVVQDRLSTYENELGEIRKVRQATPMKDIMAELGSAANRLFDEYRTSFADKPRPQADIEKLGKLCDKLCEVRKQMLEMSWADENEMNLRNLDIVSEQLVLFENEFEHVTKAQQPKQ